MCAYSYTKGFGAVCCLWATVSLGLVSNTKAAIEVVASQEFRLAGEYLVEDEFGNAYQPLAGESFDDGAANISLTSSSSTGNMFSLSQGVALHPNEAVPESHFYSDTVDYEFSVGFGGSDITLLATGTLEKTIDGVLYSGTFTHSQTIEISGLAGFEGVYTVHLGTVVLTPADMFLPDPLGDFGCPDPAASNYNPAAYYDDGSCIYSGGCTDPMALNYDALAYSDNGSCMYAGGCTELYASNYDPAAYYDDGSCIYPGGCTDPMASNYDALAYSDNGSCMYAGGYTELYASNYHPAAHYDDGSCIYPSAEISLWLF